jgi:hypothetical protein
MKYLIFVAGIAVAFWMVLEVMMAMPSGANQKLHGCAARDAAQSNRK